MPALRTFLKRFVVPDLVLFDDSLRTDVSSDLQTEVISCQKEQESGNAAVAVSERVDAQEIEVEGGHDDEGRDVMVAALVPPEVHQLPRKLRGLGGGNAAEPDPLTTGGEFLDDVYWLVFVSSRVPHVPTRQSVEVKNRFLGHLQGSALRMYDLNFAPLY
jgi:hypothetical protein